MKLLSLVLFIVFLFMVSHGHDQSDNHFSSPRLTYNYNCGTYSKMLLSYIKTLLSEVKKIKGHRPVNHNCPTIAPMNCSEVLTKCSVNTTVFVKPTESSLVGHCSAKKVYKNCAEVLKSGGTKSGVYCIDPDGKGQFKVYCDQKTNGGGWTVFQKRQDGSVDFYRGWRGYKKGFGNLKGEFWLGLDNIYRLTHQTRNRLRVELEDWKSKSAYSEYDYFAVASEKDKYKLSLGKYKGTAGDSLAYHKGMPFTTKDRDNDQHRLNCAVYVKGAWWYKGCYESSLNGPYFKGGTDKSLTSSANWYHWKKSYYPIKKAEMKIRPV